MKKFSVLLLVSSFLLSNTAYALEATMLFGGKVHSYTDVSNTCAPIAAINGVLDAVCGATLGVLCPKVKFDKLTVKLGSKQQDIGVLSVLPHKAVDNRFTRVNFFKNYIGFDFKKPGTAVVGKAFGASMACNPCANPLIKGLLKQAGADISGACENIIVKTAVQAIAAGCNFTAGQCPTNIMCYVGSSSWTLADILQFGLCPPSMSALGIPLN